MSANDKSLQTTTAPLPAGTTPIPQYYNDETDAYEAARGKDGAQSMRIEDGADVAKGAKDDAKVVDPDVDATQIALLKGVLDRNNAIMNDVSAVLAKLNATLTVSGTVNVGNTPAVDVTDDAARLVGHVTVDNLPSTQNVAGTVTANVGTTNGLALDATLTSGSQKTQVTNFPATQAITSTDGAQATIGATTDSAATSDTGSFSLIALTKRLLSQVATWVRTVGTPGSGAPTNVVMLGATDGTNAKALKVDAQSSLLVGIRNSSGVEPTIDFWGNADGTSGSFRGLNVGTYGLAYNGATWDRWRNNTAALVLASAARTATTSSPDQTLYNGRGVSVIIDVTAKGAAPSITVSIEVKDVVSGKYVAVLTSAAITTVGTTRLRVYPGITAVANLAANDVMDRTWRVNVVHANADSITYSVGKCDLL